MPHDPGPDPMSLELLKMGDDWYLFITNPILLGTQTEPSNDWQTELSYLVDVELMLVDSVNRTYFPNSVNEILDYAMPSGNVVHGEVLVSQFRDVNNSGDFDLSNDGDTVDYVQRLSTARLKIKWNRTVAPAPPLPGSNDGVYLPVAGYKRPGAFDEKDRFPIQVVSYGLNNG